MSTISVANVTTANGTTDLTIGTGNTSAGRVVIPGSGGMTLASNSTVNNIVITSGGTVVASNSTVNVITVQANSGLVLRPNNVLGTAGQVLVSNSIGGVFFSNTTKIAVKETIYEANATFTKDANLVSLIVYCVGAGGGGGGSNGLATAANSQGAAGGGGGGMAVKILQNSEVGATSNVVVGIGGAGGASWIGAGGTGSNSTFANSTGGLITGQGGSGATGATPGAGGSAINGDINISGGDGSQGLGNGVALALTLSGCGGHSALGFGHGGGAVRSPANGQPGDIYGGGGGGSASSNNTTAPVVKPGGAGANGFVWVQEFYYTNAI